jgi:serine/threonine-protein kinase
LNGEPAVQAELYETLGNIYQKLGKLDKADPLLSSALERRRAIYGPDNAEVGNSLIDLGLLRLDQGKTPDAERFVRDGLAMDRRHLPAQDPAVARATSALGQVLADKGPYEEAIKTLDEAVRLQSAQNAVSIDLADSVRALGAAHYLLGHLDTADSLYNRALAMDRQLYGTNHPRVADDMVSLGEVQHDRTDDANAERYYRKALSINQSWYGKEHPRIALSMAAVAQSLIYQQRYEEAAVLLRDAVLMQERIFGKVHPQVAQGLNTLGLLEIRRKEYRDAESDFKRMADIYRAAYNDRHYLVGIALLNLGQVYLEQKEYARAEGEYREALSRVSTDPTTTAIADIQLGRALTLQRRYGDAEPYLLAGYAVLAKQPGPQAARLQHARQDLVTVYEALHQFEKAQGFRGELNAGPADRSGKPTAR